jgi:endo-beta-N-acetylglucosaminidase D
MTDGQSASLTGDQIFSFLFNYFQTVTSMLMWGTLSGDRSGL